MSHRRIQHYPDNIIICCSKDDNEISEQKSLLEETISSLEEDISLKAQYIEKLKSNNSILLQEAIENENHLKEKLSSKDEEMRSLKLELENALKIVHQNNNMQVISVSCQTTDAPLNSVHTQTCNEMHNIVNQQTSIVINPIEDMAPEERGNKPANAEKDASPEQYKNFSLVNESSFYLEISSDEQFLVLNQECEQKDTSVFVSQHQEGLNSGEQTSEEKNSEGNIKNNNKNKNKFLIVGDEYAKNFDKIAHLLMDTSTVIIESIIKPKSELSEITQDLFSLVTTYGSNDYVLIMFNTKNISNNACLGYAIKNMLPISKFTNLIIMSELNMNIDHIIINKFLRRVNRYKYRNWNISLEIIIDDRSEKRKHHIVKELETLMNCCHHNRIVLKTVNTVELSNGDFFH